MSPDHSHPRLGLPLFAGTILVRRSCSFSSSRWSASGSCRGSAACPRSGRLSRVLSDHAVCGLRLRALPDPLRDGPARQLACTHWPARRRSRRFPCCPATPGSPSAAPSPAERSWPCSSPTSPHRSACSPPRVRSCRPGSRAASRRDLPIRSMRSRTSARCSPCSPIPSCSSRTSGCRRPARRGRGRSPPWRRRCSAARRWRGAPPAYARPLSVRFRTDEPAADDRARALWVLLAGCAVVLLMGVTNELCLDLASVPFLWILPLATYLITLDSLLRLRAHLPAGTRSSCSPPWRTFASPLEATGRRCPSARVERQFQSVRYCVFLFGACMVLHGELYRLRPAATSLTSFYLCVSGAAPRRHPRRPRRAAHARRLLRARGGNRCRGAAAARRVLDDSRGWLRRGARYWPLALGRGDRARRRARCGSSVPRRRTPTAMSSTRSARSSGCCACASWTRAEATPSVERNDAARRSVPAEQATFPPPTTGHRPESAWRWSSGSRRAVLDRRGRARRRNACRLWAPGDRFRFYEIDPAVIRLARDPSLVHVPERQRVPRSRSSRATRGSR